MQSARTVDGLNGLLADATVFYQKLRHYHWNLDGRHFFELHLKFEELYTSWALLIDQVAERVRMLDGVPYHTLRATLENAELAEDETIPAARTMVEAIEADLHAIRTRVINVVEIAESAGDRGTVTMLDDMLGGIEKDLWMLRSWRKEPAETWR